MDPDEHKARYEAHTDRRTVEGVGKLEIPSACSTDGEVSYTGGLTRRTFLAATGAIGVGVLAGCGGSSGSSPAAVDQTKAYALSTRNVSSASNAAKAHAANKRFLTPEIADANRAHPGDKSKIVPLDISPTTWNLWFGGGNPIVDLRKI